MRTIYKATEWEQNERWHCNDVSNVSKGSSSWWYPCRILDLTPANFVKLLIDKYKADVCWISPNKNNKNNGLLLWDWQNVEDMRKYKKDINAAARKKKFYI